MRTLIHILLMMIFSSGLTSGQSAQLHHSKADIYCKECHSCEKPTERDPCLICCPDFTRKGVTTRHPVEMAPEIVIIDVIADAYEASVFSHRKHAEHADMSDGCILCHHYNPPGEVATCQGCHKAERQRTNLRKPDLKAAYHRQCLGCHLEWKHENDCFNCHALKGKSQDKKKPAEETPDKSKTGQKVIAPVKKLYETDFDDGKFVTFYHNDHVRMYGLVCGDCHQNETCASCHDVSGKTVRPEKEPHDDCFSCHDTDIDENCGKCHGDAEKPPFDHAISTGWALKSYHQSLRCKACHGDKGTFTKRSRRCSACHKSWDEATFDHKVTGLELDENHLEFECESCHADENFLEKPVCNACHDEDISYPAFEPGYKIKD